MRTRMSLLGAALALTLSVLGAGAAGAADATLDVVHGIPGVDVNVCVNGSAAITDFNPGEVVTDVALPAGAYDLKIVGATQPCSAPAILEASDVELEGGRAYTAAAHLTAEGDPTLSLFRNNVRPVKAGYARLTVRHTAAAPEVDVWANGSVILEDVPNGASATLRVPAGVYAAWASLPGRYRPVIGPEVLKLRSGYAYQVFAWGDATEGYAFAVIAKQVGVR